MRSTSDLKDKESQDSKKTVHLYNDSKTDFVWNFHNKPYDIPAGEIGKFPFHTGVHLKKHLIDHIVNEREINPTYEKEVQKIREEVEVNLDK